MRRLIVLILFTLLSNAAYSAVRGEEVSYQSGDTRMQGYIAYDDALTGPRPGVLVVHEWWGHNEYARKRARLLAAMGYTALAVDMYGEGRTADHPEDAGRFAGEVRKNMAAATERFQAAMALLQKHPTVNPEQLSAIGYCFGGGLVLEMARRGLDLDLVASFHGSLGTDMPAKEDQVKARIMVYHGADDPFVKPEQITAFNEEMEAAGIDYQFISYPGAKHSFTNPEADSFGAKFELPLAYDLEADHLSWADMLEQLSVTYSE